MDINDLAPTSDMVCQDCYDAMAADPDFLGDLNAYIVSSSCIGCYDPDA